MRHWLPVAALGTVDLLRAICQRP